MHPSREQIADFVRALDLPRARPQARSFGAPAAPVQFDAAPQALAIGEQVAAFAASVSPDVRSAIADNLLLAQLAADKAADSGGDVLGWYRSYVDVLKKLGWLVESMEFEEQNVGETNAGVHTAIIPVVTAMLGGLAALPLVLAVLNGLKDMDSSSKWITVFNRASQHARGAKFQISSVDADAAGNPRLTVLCFAVLANHTVTQLLFFKLSQDEVDMQSARSTLTMTAEQLAASRAAIAARVQPFIVDFVNNIDI